MLIQLPVETWIEILDWLRRRDLLKKLDSLWDREFTPIVQDWLHKYTRNVKLGRLSAVRHGLSVLNESSWREEHFPFAEVELPGNITGFKLIEISYLDSTTLAFLHRMRPLFHNICLVIHNGVENQSLTQTQTALPFLMRQILSGGSTIESIVLPLENLQFFTANSPPSILPLLANAKLIQIWGHSKLDATSEQLLTDWLFTPREDGLPRTLLLWNNCRDPAAFWAKLRERFMDPTRQSACPFFIGICHNLPPMESAKNFQTGEQLRVNGHYSSELFCNCALANNVVFDREWLAKEEEVRNWDFSYQQQVIWLNSPLELGPLNDDDDENAEEEAI